MFAPAPGDRQDIAAFSSDNSQPGERQLAPGSTTIQTGEVIENLPERCHLVTEGAQRGLGRTYGWSRRVRDWAESARWMLEQLGLLLIFLPPLGPTSAPDQLAPGLLNFCKIR